MGQQNMGDTTLTKVFVGGLAWETQKDALQDHFDKYGDIIEAVIISDKLTGRSKGYGFVTFKEAEAAKKACEDGSPVINGRRANCNLASLGARRQRSSPPVIPPLSLPHKSGFGNGGGMTGMRSGPPVPWYYYPAGTPSLPSPYHQHQQYTGVLPFYPAASYGYSTAYMTDLAYSAPAKLNHHPQGQFSYPPSNNAAMVPVYHPMYQFHHRPPSHSMGVPAHFYPHPTATGTATTMPTIISKPPAQVCLAVGQVTGC